MYTDASLNLADQILPLVRREIFVESGFTPVFQADVRIIVAGACVMGDSAIRFCLTSFRLRAEFKSILQRERRKDEAELRLQFINWLFN